MGEPRGTIGFFATYRPPVPLEIYSSPTSPSPKTNELEMTDGVSYNYNANVIPPSALKTLLTRPMLKSEATASDVDSGRVSGLVMVSERTSNLETLHIALRFNDNPPKVKVFNFGKVYGIEEKVRMEDSGCVAGKYLVYVSTKDQPKERRQPWTAVYKTNLETATTERLTPKEEADLSPSVSPSGKKIAVASFQEKAGWDGEIEDLGTDIFVMNVDKPFKRTLVINNGGWPTWGSETVLFFHRKVGDDWAVYRADITNGKTTQATRVTPVGIHAMTPAAINATTVAVATIRKKSTFADVRVEDQYRHIEIFDSTGEKKTVQITRKITPKADHYNPFVIPGKPGANRIGYHRTKSLGPMEDIPRQNNTILSPHKDVGLFRVSGVFPTFSKDGSQLAFVDNEFKAVWLADSQGLRIVHETEGADNVWSPVFGQSVDYDVLYVCIGPSFNAKSTVEIFAIFDVSSNPQEATQLTKGEHNNGFPSTDPQGKRLVFRSTRDGGPKKYKNLYIMEDALEGEYGEDGRVTRLTHGNCVDTHCQWSPNGKWIVFSSTRDKPQRAIDDPDRALDNGLDAGYFAVFLVNPDVPEVVVRVLGSRYELPKDINNIAGHVNHPFFSPDGKSIVVAADLAAVSADPISMPLFLHSVRPYGDIFTVDIDPEDISKNKDVKQFKRITHSRYENSTASWTMFSTSDPNAQWSSILDQPYTPSCPYAHDGGGQSWHMTGHLCIPKRCC